MSTEGEGSRGKLIVKLLVVDERDLAHGRPMMTGVSHNGDLSFLILPARSPARGLIADYRRVAARVSRSALHGSKGSSYDSICNFMTYR